MQDEYGSPWLYRAQWAYLLLIVVSLMSPVFYVMYISFNENGCEQLCVHAGLVPRHFQ